MASAAERSFNQGACHMSTTSNTNNPTRPSVAAHSHGSARANAAVNGINVSALREFIAEVTTQPARAATTWKIHSRWGGGTRSDHQVAGYSIGGAWVERPFTIRIDEPLELCGTNAFANPQEYLLAALNACMMVGYVAVASLMNIPLTRLEVETTGNIDLRGFLGIDPATPAGYPALEQTVRIAGDATPEQFAQLHAAVRATSPNYYNLTRAIPTSSRLVIENGPATLRA
jgi:uncharacterized OsmC-like protein